MSNLTNTHTILHTTSPPAHPATEQVIHLYASPQETLGVTYSLLLSFSLSLDSCRVCVMTAMLILSCETEMMTEWKKEGRHCSNKVLSQPRSGKLWGEKWSRGHWRTYFPHWKILSVWLDRNFRMRLMQKVLVFVKVSFVWCFVILSLINTLADGSAAHKAICWKLPITNIGVMKLSCINIQKFETYFSILAY